MASNCSHGRADTGVQSSFPYDLRFPGQYFQAETGRLNQNVNRDYDPVVGRYVEGDPVGLLGAYIYAYDSPTRHTDQFGLAPKLPEVAGKDADDGLSEYGRHDLRLVWSSVLHKTNVGMC